MKKLRIGFLGTAGIGRKNWKAIFHSGNCVVAVVASRDVEKSRKYIADCQREFAFAETPRALGSYEELLASPDVDAVYIPLPTGLRKDFVLRAAQNGKHVLCEKPMGRDLKECEAIFAAAKKAKGVHMVCHNYRRIPAIALAKRMLSEGTLGKLYHFRARYAQDRLADVEFPLDWRLQKETSGSGVHSDIGSHIVDLARYLVGEFTQVCGVVHTFVPERPRADLLAKGKRQLGKVTAPDSSAFIGWLENGVMANLEATRYALGRRNHIEIEINGSKGSLCFDFEDMNRLKYYNGDDPKDRQGFRDILVTQRDGIQPYVANWWPPGHGLGYEHTFVHAIADFVNACADGKSVHPTLEDGLKNQRVLTAVEKSSATGKWIKV